MKHNCAATHKSECDETLGMLEGGANTFFGLNIHGLSRLAWNCASHVLYFLLILSFTHSKLRKWNGGATFLHFYLVWFAFTLRLWNKQTEWYQVARKSTVFSTKCKRKKKKKKLTMYWTEQKMEFFPWSPFIFPPFPVHILIHPLASLLLHETLYFHFPPLSPYQTRFWFCLFFSSCAARCFLENRNCGTISGNRVEVVWSCWMICCTLQISHALRNKRSQRLWNL